MIKHNRPGKLFLLATAFLFLQGSLFAPGSVYHPTSQNTPTSEISPKESPIPAITGTPAPLDRERREILKDFIGSWVNYRTLPLIGDETVGQYTGMRMKIDAEGFSVAGMVCRQPEYSSKIVSSDEFFLGYNRPGDKHEFFDTSFNVLRTGCENFEPASVALINFHSIGFILEDELLLFEPDQSVIENGISIESDMVVEYNEDPFYEIRAQVPVIQEPEMTGYNNHVREVVEEAIEPFKTELENWDLPDEMASYRSYMWIGYDVEYLSKDLVSIRYLVEFYYAGAAHPGHYFKVINFDLKSGKDIRFDELFVDNGKALNFLSAYCRNQLEKKDIFLFEEGLQPIRENFNNWNFESEGLRISFDPYQVAPYAAGSPSILVPYTQLDEYLDPKSPIGSILAQ